MKATLLNSEAGYVRIRFLMWWDTTAKRGFGHWAGYRITTSDDADFAYDFRGGAETMIVQSRIGTSWTCCGMSDFVGDAELLEGTDKIGVLQAGITAGSEVVLQLDTGEAENFTVGNKYFIYDFDDHTWGNLCEVTATNTSLDQITIDTADYNYPAGAVIGAYVHRWIAFGNGTATGATNINQSNASTIPYINATAGYSFHNQYGSILSGAFGSICSGYLDRVAPNSKGYWGTEDLYVIEYNRQNTSGSSSDAAHEAYGTVKNVIATNAGTLSAGLDGRTVAGTNYMYFLLMSSLFAGGSSSFAALFLDTTSTS
jgi:hypothetical protein